MKKNILLFVVTLFFVISCKLESEIYTNTNDISETINSLFPKVIELNNVSVKAHSEDGYCGISSVTIMSNYYNSTNYEVNDLIKRRNAHKGASFDDTKKWLQLELPGKNIIFEINIKDEDMIRDIHASLNNNNPVLIFFGAQNPFNKPFYDFHASVVYGIDLDNKTITIANTYGYIEKTSLVDFLNRMSFIEIDKYPLVQQVSLIRKSMDKNSYFLVN